MQSQNKPNEFPLPPRDLVVIGAHERCYRHYYQLFFTLASPAVTCPIPGMKTPEQAKQNAAAADGELDRATLKKIDAICPPGKSA